MTPLNVGDVNTGSTKVTTSSPKLTPLLPRDPRRPDTANFDIAADSPVHTRPHNDRES